jgi:hypothetical protein
MRQPAPEEAAVAAEIDRIRALAPEALRRHWRAMFGRKPPPGLSKDLLGRMIAWHLQEQAFGGLDRDSLSVLDRLARQRRPPARALKPGTVLVRDYQGRRHTVTVTRTGFDWQGTSYPSLSAIARAITGTAWSGPRFFALRPRRDGAHAAAAESTPESKPAAAPHPGQARRRTAAAHSGSQRATRAKDGGVHLHTTPPGQP